MAESTGVQDSPENAYQGRTPTSEVHYRIDTSEFAILLFFAGLFDLLGLLGFIPGVGAIIDGIAQSIIGLIFVINRVSLLKRRFLVRFLLFTVIEFIPFLGMLPTLMAEVYMLASLSWIADRALATATKAASKVVGERVAGAAVGLAYGRMITGQVPLSNPDDVAKQPKSLRQAVGSFGNAMGSAIKNDVAGQFGGMPASKIPPAQRGGGATFVDGVRADSAAKAREEAREKSLPAQTAASAAASVDGIRTDVAATDTQKPPVPAAPEGISASVDGVLPQEKYNEQMYERLERQAAELPKRLPEKAVASGSAQVREVSREKYSPERTKLAQELRAQRKEQKTKIAEIQERSKQLADQLSSGRADYKTLEADRMKILGARDAEAASLSGRLLNLLKIQSGADKTLEAEEKKNLASMMTNRDARQAAQAELQQGVQDLAEADTSLRGLKDKIGNFYGTVAENEKKTIKQAGVRNKVFFAHVFSDAETVNGNNLASKPKDFADSIDILTALEPSISASSVGWTANTEGKVGGLWGGGYAGVILGDGDIQAAAAEDSNTLGVGIKRRAETRDMAHSSEDIDAVIESSSYKATPGAGERAKYNEFIVNNPKVAGFFITPKVIGTEQGLRLASAKEAEKQLSGSKDEMERVVGNFREQIKIAGDRNLPFYIRDDRNRLSQCTGISDDGTLALEKGYGTLDPESLSHQKSGLSEEERKETGLRLLSQNVFTERTQKEAEKIVRDLGGASEWREAA